MSTTSVATSSKSSVSKEAEALDEIQKMVRAARRKVMAQLRKLFEPHMWDSGYRTGPTDNRHAMKVWTPRDADGKSSMVTFNGHSLTEFWGYSEIGIITDAYGGGCITETLASFSLEDLLMLYKWAIKQFPNKD